MDSSNLASAGLIAVGSILLFAVFYIALQLPYYKLAKKMNDEAPWMAWVPVLNLFQLARLAQKPGWWGILILVPFVGIIIYIMMMVEVLKRLKQESIMVLLFIVPVANIIYPYYLAFSDDVTFNG